MNTRCDQVHVIHGTCSPSCLVTSLKQCQVPISVLPFARRKGIFRRTADSGRSGSAVRTPGHSRRAERLQTAASTSWRQLWLSAQTAAHFIPTVQQKVRGDVGLKVRLSSHKYFKTEMCLFYGQHLLSTQICYTFWVYLYGGQPRSYARSNKRTVYRNVCNRKQRFPWP
jgi:hypothetical protein